jgi:putative tributyrin esterase
MKLGLRSLLTRNRTRGVPLGSLALLFAVTFNSANYPLAIPIHRDSTPNYPLATASGSVETVQFRSTLIGKTLPYSVVLPPHYRASRTTRYPVLYLLHGFAGHYSDWLTRTNVADYASKYRLIIVTPEGNDGWYTDSATIAADKYESYFLKELMPDVQKRFRTIDSRYGRGVAGLSMGGYGALKFGIKSPGTFVFAGSMSGALDAASWTAEEMKDFGALRDSVLAAFGPVGSETRKANNIVELVKGMSAARVAGLPFLYLDCGTEDFVFGSNPPFAALLREKKIPHEYRQLPGNHNWAYWDQQVEEMMKVAAKHLRAPR